MSSPKHPESLAEQALVDGLLDPAVYPWRPESVSHVETHMSRLFFAGDRVVKLKRPVRYGFVDHLTLERRRQSCLDEVRLNRRLSDDVYLDAVPVTRRNGGFQLGGDGESVEWATVMRRLPDTAMLDHVLKTGATPERLADRLAARLIPFHKQAGPCPGDAAQQAADAERIVRENLDEIAALTTPAIFPREFALIREIVLDFLERNSMAIRHRAEQGWIREGHGDLKCEHIVLDPPGALQVYDCVEFSQAIRCADIASDLAFLLLDLERLGAGRVASALVERYRAAGLDLPDQTLDLYRTHRALVRVKVAALTIENATTQPDSLTSRTVADWLHLAAAAAMTARPAVIAMTGFSGTGKSVVARDIARALNAPTYSTDAIRRETAEKPSSRYAPDKRLANYLRLIDRARDTLRLGSPVVLDGAFLRDEERALAADLGRETDVPLLFIEVTADPDVVEQRIQQRSRGESPAFGSEATLAVLQAQRASVAAAPSAWPAGSIPVTIDTSADAPASLDPLFAALTEQGLIRSALVTEAPQGD